MKKTGELLKHGRESSNLTLSEVALATKINPKVLIAIECGDERNLPAKTFLKGFVRSYAIFLKMDVDEVLRSFVEDTGGPVPAPTHEAYQKQDPATQSARRSVQPEGSSNLRTAAIVVIVLLICAIIGVRELVDKYQRERVAASTPADLKVIPLVEPKVAQKVEVAAPAPKAEPKLEAAAAPKVEARRPKKEPAPLELPPAKDLNFQTVLSAAERPILMSVATGIPKTLEQPVFAKHEPASVNPAVADEPAPAAGPTPTVEPTPAPPVNAAPPVVPASGKNEVIIEALDQVQVKVLIAGETKAVALAPNEVYTLRSSGTIALDLSDGGAVNLIHNGRIKGVPGKLGEPKQVKIP